MYRFQEKNGMNKLWSKWYAAKHVAQAFHEMMSEVGCDDESWQKSKKYWYVEKR